MFSKWLFGGLIASFLGLGMLPAQAQNVKLTALGSVEGELCALDRAILMEDPSGVRILIAPGRTVNAGDPRLGDVHVILLDHAHGDHMGNLAGVACNGSGGTNLAPFPSVVRIAAEKNSALLVGGELAEWLLERLTSFGESAVDCGTNPAATEGVRGAACAGVLRPGATREITLNGQPTGVRISTIQATHSNGIAGAFTSAGALPPGLNAYGGTENGYIIRFSNGLSVLWTGDSGFFGDMELFSKYYGVNMAIVHIGDIFTMGPDEAAFAVNHLIKPRTVIPTHVNEVATSGGSVVGAKTARFISQVNAAKVILPTSGDTISCDGRGSCKKAQ